MTILSSEAQGQHAITITVMDSSGTPVAGALVTLENDNYAGLSFQYTNDEGSVIINKIPQQAILIKVSSMGFKIARVRLQPKRNAYTILLAARAVVLDPVVVRDKQRPRVISRGDTTLFRVRDFMSPADRTLEDVLRKLPGVEVRPNGQILFKEKPVGNLLIEGDNLLGNRYQLATQNLEKGMVDTLEFIENHQRRKILQGRERGRNTDLNITLTDKAKMHWIKIADLGVGLPEQYLGKLTAMAFRPKLKTINSGEANDAGRDILDKMAELGAPGFHAGDQKPFLTPFLSAGDFPTPPLSDDRWLRNHSLMASGNVLLKRRKDQTLTLNAGYGRQQEDQSYTSSQTWFLPGDTIVRAEQGNQRKTTQPINLSIQTENNAKENYFQNKTNLSYKEFTSQSELTTQDDVINQNHHSQSLTLSNELSGMFLFKKKWIPRFQSLIEYNHQPESLNIMPGVLADIINDSNYYTQTKQKIDYSNFHTYNSLGITFGNGNFNQTYKLGFSFTSETVSSGLSGKDGTTEIDFGNTYQNKGTYQRFSPFIISSWDLDLERQQLSASLLVEVPQLRYDDQHHSVIQKKNDFRLTPSLSYTVKVGKENKWVSRASLSQRDNFMQSIYKGTYLQNYRTLYQQDQPLHTSLSKRVSSTFSFQKSIQVFFAHIGVSYSQSQNDWLNNMTITDKHTVLGSVYHPHSRNNLGYNAGVSKYIFGLRTNLSVKYEGSSSKSIQLQNGEVFPAHIFSNNFDIVLQKKIKNFMEILYSLHFGNSLSRIDFVSKSEKRKNNKSQQDLTINITPKKWVISTTLSHTSIRSVEKITFFFADAFIRYKLSKPRMDISFNAINLTGLDNYVQYNLSANSEYYSRVQLRPTSFFVKCYFSF